MSAPHTRPARTRLGGPPAPLPRVERPAPATVYQARPGALPATRRCRLAPRLRRQPTDFDARCSKPPASRTSSPSLSAAMPSRAASPIRCRCSGLPRARAADAPRQLMAAARATMPPQRLLSCLVLLYSRPTATTTASRCAPSMPTASSRWLDEDRLLIPVVEGSRSAGALAEQRRPSAARRPAREAETRSSAATHRRTRAP